MKITLDGQPAPSPASSLDDLSELGAPGTTETAGQASGALGVAFERTIADASRLEAQATANAESLARGTNDDLHGAMISSKEADISLKLVGSIRNRLLDAFHELWRINL